MIDSNITKELENLNPWWDRGFVFEKVIPREYYTKKLLDKDSKTIQIVTGSRRVGKTTLMKDIIQNLLSDGIDPKNIIFVTAELPALKNISILDIYNYCLKNTNKKELVYFFVDEIQELKRWQIQVKYLYDNYKVKFYLTGSSGLIINKQTSKLTGRFVETHLLPLSFSEFLEFRKNKSSVEEYLDTGGYPEFVLNKDTDLLLQTVESIMYRDLLSLYGIRNPSILKDLLQLLCDKVGTSVSFNTIANDLKIDPHTAQFYIKYLQDVYLIYPLFREGRSHKIVKGFVPKYYINDTGILKLYSKTPRQGHLFENAIFLHLYRKSLNTHKDLNYGYINEHEVDFIYDNLLYEAKSKPLTPNLNNDISYIVNEKQASFGYKQILLSDFLLS